MVPSYFNLLIKKDIVCRKTASNPYKNSSSVNISEPGV